MRIAIVTLDAFNELDSIVALNILNRVAAPGWKVQIASPSPRVVSMNGLTVDAHVDLSAIAGADAVVIGSGRKTREHALDQGLLDQLKLDPSRQLIASQCSGALLLAAKGFLTGSPACTDLKTRPSLQAAGVEVLDQPFVAHGNVATAGGCLASQYLAAWIIARAIDVEAAVRAVQYVLPVGESEVYTQRILDRILPYLPDTQATASAVR